MSASLSDAWQISDETAGSLAFPEINADTYQAEFAIRSEELDVRPRLVVDRKLNVLWACDRTDRIIAPPMPLQIQHGKLVADCPGVNAQLTELLQAVGSDPSVKLIRAEGSPYWIVVRAWKARGPQDAICLICSPSAPLRDITKCGLAEVLNLTRKEALVLERFAQLSTPKMIASDMGVSLNTVRAHLKSVHVKASVSSSTQLLRLIHTFCSE